MSITQISNNINQDRTLLLLSVACHCTLHTAPKSRLQGSKSSALPVLAIWKKSSSEQSIEVIPATTSDPIGPSCKCNSLGMHLCDCCQVTEHTCCAAVLHFYIANSSICIHVCVNLFPFCAGERAAMRAVLSIAMGGASALTAERKDTHHGGAREGAVLAALKLLRLGFERDVDVVQALRTSEAGTALNLS